MSQENVELIRRGPEVLRGGEWSAVSLDDFHATLTEWAHPDVEWHDQRELPGATVHHGIGEVVRHIAAAREAWDYYRAWIRYTPTTDGSASMTWSRSAR